jgi:hypothetical protein
MLRLVTALDEATMSNDESNLPLVTIDAAVMLVRERTGIPISRSRIHKDSARGIAPKPDAIYGRRYLWQPEKILAYAQTLIKRREAQP